MFFGILNAYLVSDKGSCNELFPFKVFIRNFNWTMTLDNILLFETNELIQYFITHSNVR